MRLKESNIRWELVWLVFAALTAIGMNIYTGSPVLDLTFGHIAIALVVATIPTAVCFGIVESFVFIRGLFSQGR